MKLNELNEAELRLEFRRTVKEVGRLGSWQILYEMLFGANVLLDVMKEEFEDKDGV